MAGYQEFSFHDGRTKELSRCHCLGDSQLRGSLDVVLPWDVFGSSSEATESCEPRLSGLEKAMVGICSGASSQHDLF
jgi:hypothetical protein